MTLCAEDLELINRLTLRLYQALDPETQTQAMLQVLSDLTPCQAAAWTEFDVSTRAIRVVSIPHVDSNRGKLLDAAGRYAHQSPFPAYFAASGDPTWRMISDFIPIEDFQKTDFFMQALADWGPHQIGCVLAREGSLFKALTLNRLSTPFTERDRAALNLIYPHLCLSHSNACAFDSARQSARELRLVVESASSGYAYIGLAGQVEWSTEKARQLWDKFYKEEPKHEAGIPSSVIHWARHALAAATQNKASCHGHVLEKQVGLERLAIRLVPAALEGWILAIESHQVTRRPRFVPIPLLSDRENEVLGWMTEGKRNTEIGIILGISHRTVEKHVESILSRLGVENRAAAIVQAMGMSASMQAP